MKSQGRIYPFLKTREISVNWQAAKNFNRCRQQFVKQLDIHPLYKKIQLFEQACSTVLDQHHLIGLHLLSKKTLKEAKRTRRRHMLQNIIYGQLEKKGRSVDISEEEYKKVRQAFLEEQRENPQNFAQSNEVVAKLQKQFSRNYKKLSQGAFMGEHHSKKILQKLQEKQREEELLSIPEDEDGQQGRVRHMLNAMIHSDRWSQLMMRARALRICLFTKLNQYLQLYSNI